MTQRHSTTCSLPPTRSSPIRAPRKRCSLAVARRSLQRRRDWLCGTHACDASDHGPHPPRVSGQPSCTLGKLLVSSTTSAHRCPGNAKHWPPCPTTAPYAATWANVGASVPNPCGGDTSVNDGLPSNAVLNGYPGILLRPLRFPIAEGSSSFVRALTGASNGPTEAMNLLVKKIKRCGHGFTSFRNYRLRALLHCGGIKWDAHPATTMRARSPQLVA
ncbi:MAG: transposase [Acidimicrobiales bacterium]